MPSNSIPVCQALCIIVDRTDTKTPGPRRLGSALGVQNFKLHGQMIAGSRIPGN